MAMATGIDLFMTTISLFSPNSAMQMRSSSITLLTIVIFTSKCIFCNSSHQKYCKITGMWRRAFPQSMRIKKFTKVHFKENRFLQYNFVTDCSVRKKIREIKKYFYLEIFTDTYRSHLRIDVFTDKTMTTEITITTLKDRSVLELISEVFMISI